MSAPARLLQAMHELLVFPCNGNGIEALDALAGHFRMLCFVDDAVDKQGRVVAGHEVHARDAFARHPEAMVLAVPGSPLSYRERRHVIEDLGLPAARFAQVIHPAARVSPLATIGHNVLIMAGVVITANAVIGDHVCVLPNTVVHHDVRIGDWSLVGANVCIAGHTQIGNNCYIGSGSSLMNGVTIGDGALVGLGSTVIRPVPRGQRVAGNPARALD